MQSAERCSHGILWSIGCCICDPKQDSEIVEKCEHGYSKEDFCYGCHEKKQSDEYIAKEKDRYTKMLNDLSPSLRHNGVPAKYLDRSYETFTGNQKAIDECKKYQSGSCVLHGQTGCGKTHLAVSIMRERLKNDILGLIEREWEQGHAYSPEYSKFVTIPDLLLEIRSSFHGEPEETEEQIIDKYSTVPFLILDDLGSEKTTDFAITTLYIIIDRRDRELLPTVVTTNLSSQEIEEKLDARIASRLAGWKNIKINMPDYRKKR
jgi:DNA replication protein DnaC